MTFTAHHLDATAADLCGNGGRGRYMLLPGSPGRAAAIAGRLSSVTIRPHPRGHDLHLGTLAGPAGPVDVGCVATGMGGPSTEIIVTELLELGCRRLLRVGTAGSLQERVRLGDLVIASAAVRDEGAGDDYLPRSFPALAALPLVGALQAAAASLKLGGRVHTGLVHSKNTLYAREFERGPLAASHAEHKRLLRAGGVLASEMECAALFVLGMVADQAAQLESPPGRVEAGAVLAVIGDAEVGFAEGPAVTRTIEAAVEVALEALRHHAADVSPG